MYFVGEEEEHTYVPAHPILHWSIILLSSQNILFYLYWSPLYTYIEKILIKKFILKLINIPQSQQACLFQRRFDH